MNWMETEEFGEENDIKNTISSRKPARPRNVRPVSLIPVLSQIKTVIS